MNRVIAIDGPSASGKSTVSKRVAAKLGDLYVDSGAVYRGVTWCALQRNVWGDAAACVRILPELGFEMFVKDGAVKWRMDGRELGPELRTDIINEKVSRIAATPEIRVQVVAWLRDMLRFGNLVMEGRDIGSAVFPDAAHKFYIDADPAERARRRSAEVAGADMGKVGDSLKRRDEIDSKRAKDPLKVAPGAVVLDTTGMSIAQVVEAIVERVRR